MKLLLSIAGLSLAVALFLGGTTPSGPSVSVVPALVKVRPGVEVRGRIDIALSAARGECAGSQIVVRPPVRELRASAAALQGPEGAHLELSLYREDTLTLERASSSQGEPGRWPDPLIPARDQRGEERAAFPVSSSVDPVVLYVELCVPRAAPAGVYLGDVVLHSLGRADVRVPVRVRVRSFVLHATSTLATAFGFSPYSAAVGHGIPQTPENLRALGSRYAEEALRHRISLFGLVDPPPFTVSEGELRLDVAEHDAALAPFMDGTALSSGARFTSTDARLHPRAKSDAQKVAYLRALAAHLRKRGWLDRTFVYAKDEPKEKELDDVQRFAALVHRADRGLRVLVTASRHPTLDGQTDIFAPNINCLFRRPGSAYCDRVVGPDGYRTRGKRAPPCGGTSPACRTAAATAA
jgi:hypothetical protein